MRARAEDGRARGGGAGAASSRSRSRRPCSCRSGARRAPPPTEAEARAFEAELRRVFREASRESEREACAVARAPCSRRTAVA